MKSQAQPIKSNILIVPHCNKIRIINPHEILYIKARDNYSIIWLKDNKIYTVCMGLSQIENRLQNFNFFRCHRSFLVNMNYIREIIKGKSCHLVISSGDYIPIARRKIFLMVNSLKNQSELYRLPTI
jgi:DNA-binding LytR/AlgR family response regulator